MQSMRRACRVLMRSCELRPTLGLDWNGHSPGYGVTGMHGCAVEADLSETAHLT